MIVKIYKYSLKIKGENDNEISKLQETFMMDGEWTEEVAMEPIHLYNLLYDLTLNFNIHLQ